MGQSAFDGTFVQFLHCHLSFVRFAAQEVGFQKNITCFGRKVLRKVQIADGFIRRQALILLVGRSRFPLLYVHILGPKIVTEVQTLKAKFKKGAMSCYLSGREAA